MNYSTDTPVNMRNPESAARDPNLTDIAERIEQLLSQAHMNLRRTCDAGDILSGAQGATDGANKIDPPKPAALLHRMGFALTSLEVSIGNQRQALNRLHASLEEPKGVEVAMQQQYENQRGLGTGSSGGSYR